MKGTEKAGCGGPLTTGIYTSWYRCGEIADRPLCAQCSLLDEAAALLCGAEYPSDADTLAWKAKYDQWRQR